MKPSATNERLRRNRRNHFGFSLIEIVFALLVGSIVTAIAVPVTRSAIASYQLVAAADTVTGAIQAARYEAIMHGYPYQFDLNGTTDQYQLSSEPGGATAFAAIGTALPVSALGVTINVGTTNSASIGHVILQFKPNGSVAAASGQSMPISFTISLHGTTKTLTVSNYGSVSVQ